MPNWYTGNVVNIRFQFLNGGASWEIKCEPACLCAALFHNMQFVHLIQPLCYLISVKYIKISWNLTVLWGCASLLFGVHETIIGYINKYELADGW